MTADAAGEVDRGDDAGAIPREQYERRRAASVVAAVHEDAERVKRRELEEALGGLDAHGEFSGVQRDAVEAMADAIVERLLAAPARRVRRAGDPPTLGAAVRLFDLDPETGFGVEPGEERTRQEGASDGD